MPPCFACLAWPAGNEDATRRAEHLVSALETHQPERPTAFQMPGLYLAASMAPCFAERRAPSGPSTG